MRTSLKRKMVALCLMVTVCILISACGSAGINGTYVSQGLISQTFTFDGDEVHKHELKKKMPKIQALKNIKKETKKIKRFIEDSLFGIK